MANMELITSITVGAGGAASVTLPATGTIPQTYTDLKVLISARSDEAGGTAQSTVFVMSINGVTTDRTFRNLIGYQGTLTASQSLTGGTIGIIPGAAVTATTFNNFEVYIPNYTSSNNKSFSVDAVTENNNASNNDLRLTAGLWSQTAAITTLGFTLTGGNIVQGSTFYLYGISNVTSTTKATGGIVSSDGVYNYHMFPFSGTYTPTIAHTADILVIGGGGAGGANIGGGGGAGGLRYFASESLTTTNYTCTVGAGGNGPSASPPYVGTNGGTSQFGALTSAVGGGFGGGSNNGSASGSGASSGGNRGPDPIGSASLGNIGANHTSINGAGGGGGFGTAGTQGTASVGGAGGNGVDTYSSWAFATQTGDNGYYAGGGGGSGFPFGSGGPAGLGGLGGGGKGFETGNSLPSPGKTNTGGGGGGGFDNGTTNPVQFNNGGSGIVIIRYAI